MRCPYPSPRRKIKEDVPKNLKKLRSETGG
jgi:hypothetical protein